MPSRRLSAFILIAGLVGCGGPVGGPVGGDDESVGDVSLPIEGGYDDFSDTAIVSVLHMVTGELCTGTLIAPNLVLTARHCVGSELGATALCEEVSFDALFAASELTVGSAADVSPAGGEFGVVEIVTLPGATPELCGRDVALLILDQSSPAAAYTPGIATPLSANASYSIVGFGATDSSNNGVGSRRRRDNLTVTCVGSECADDQVHADEWLGGAGVCIGDSGGPALDSAGQVVGVISRGPPSCATVTFGQTFAWAEWLKNTALHASDIGGYVPPAWAAGVTVSDDDDGGDGADEGCSVSRGAAGQSSGSSAAWMLLLGLGLLRLRRSVEDAAR